MTASLAEIQPGIRFAYDAGTSERTGKPVMLEGVVTGPVTPEKNCIHLGPGTHHVEVAFSCVDGSHFPGRLNFTPDFILSGETMAPITFEDIEQHPRLSLFGDVAGFSSRFERRFGHAFDDTPPENLFTSLITLRP